MRMCEVDRMADESILELIWDEDLNATRLPRAPDRSESVRG